MSSELALGTTSGVGDEPAGVEAFRKLLGVITDPDVPAEQVETTAWTPIIKQWAQGWTHALVEALLESNIELQAFLGQLLRRIWVTMLGDDPKVIGTYVAPLTFRFQDFTPTIPHGLAVDLHDLLDSGHPGFRNLDRYKNPWGDHFHPPAGHTWTSTSAHVTTSRTSPSSLTDVSDPGNDVDTILRDMLIVAKNAKEDINVLLMRAISHCSSGLTDAGQSAEARAFLACYTISLYSPTLTSMNFATSPRTTHLMTTIDNLTTEDVIYLYSQLGPILLGLLSEKDHNAPIPPRHPASILALWYFFIEFAKRRPLFRTSQVPDTVISALGNMHQSKDAFPILSGGDNSSTHVSLATVVAWIVEYVLLIATSSPASNDTNVYEPHTGNPTPKRRKVSWLGSTTVSEVDSCVDSLRTFGLDTIWRRISPGFHKETIDMILKAEPRDYGEHVDTVCKEILEAYMSDTTLEETKTRIVRLWVQLVALDDGHLEAFTNMAVNLDKTQSTAVFSALLKFFNPVPMGPEMCHVQPLQKEYDEKRRSISEERPSYLVVRFIQILTPLARYHTVLTQTLNECGILTILSAIRDGRYHYPETDNPIPEAARKAIEVNICDDMLSALSERIYIAAQAKLLLENPGEMYTHEPSQTRRPIRRRPSWMATGG
ncbi:hypothetical protein BDY19DRAFT_970526 [Irpex rosettiformis]|uniref:Uncharacterized protein n=1 Tax=Irpex rosettiformis TaxID=378272 RepID=A0ACB8TRJ9_9APHY|nr:hypothetical protein BDY19DRAFT_970526 [Irpex rosettiformis]